MTDEELQQALHNQAEEYRKSGLRVLKIPTVCKLSTDTVNVMKKHPNILGAFIKCYYQPCIQVRI